MDHLYTSIFSPDKKVSSAQYISELVCKNKAYHFKMELPTKFWEFPEWQKYYKAQIFRCHQYLKYYSADVLIKVIKEKNIWSLYATWIVDEFIKEKNRLASIKIKDVNHERIMNSTGIINKKIDFSKFD